MTEKDPTTPTPDQEPIEGELTDEQLENVSGASGGNQIEGDSDNPITRFRPY